MNRLKDYFESGESSNDGSFLVRGVKVRINNLNGNTNCAIYSSNLALVKQIRRYLEIEGFLRRDKNLVEA